MAPIKFEENIKDKLEKRTLSPSAEGWSKLSNRLDTDQKKSKNPIFWWLSIAAGLIIMIAVSAHFFKSNIEEDNSPQMVNEKPEIINGENDTPQLNDNKTIELADVDDSGEEKKENLPISKKPQIIEYSKQIQKQHKNKEQLAKNDSNDLKKLGNNKKEENKEITGNSIMKEAIAEAMNDIKSENATVSDREIDSLLKIASKELFKEQLQKESAKTVDANALLMSVEDEMGQSFRSKVFEALKESYETVRTAVADRNN